MSAATAIDFGIDLISKFGAAYQWPAEPVQALIDAWSALPDADDDPLPVGWWTRPAAMVRASGLPNCVPVADAIQTGNQILDQAERGFWDEAEETAESLVSSYVSALTAPVVGAVAVTGAVTAATGRDLANSAQVVGVAAAPTVALGVAAVKTVNRAGDIAAWIGIPLALGLGAWALKKAL